MRVGFVQFQPVFGAVARNIAKAVDLVRGKAADIWVLPELFATGYQFRDRAEAAFFAEDPDGPTIATLAAKAAQFGCTFCGGFAERGRQGAYNSAFLVGPGGVAGIYRKVHLFGRERELFRPGDGGFATCNVAGVSVGMMICFDWIFPESARTLALLGAQVILHPSNLVLPHCPEAMKTRALENRVFTVTANRTGREERVAGETLDFIGQSVIYAPDGSALARAGREEETASAVEIAEEEALDKAATASNDLFLDRRPSLYKS